jgi:hypothetical protein
MAALLLQAVLSLSHCPAWADCPGPHHQSPRSAGGGRLQEGVDSLHVIWKFVSTQYKVASTAATITSTQGTSKCLLSLPHRAAQSIGSAANTLTAQPTHTLRTPNSSGSSLALGSHLHLCTQHLPSEPEWHGPHVHQPAAGQQP